MWNPLPWLETMQLVVLAHSSVEGISRKAHRANAASSSTVEYFLRNVAKPFCDYITRELNTTFSEDKRAGEALFSSSTKTHH